MCSALILCTGSCTNQLLSPSIKCHAQQLSWTALMQRRLALGEL